MSSLHPLLTSDDPPPFETRRTPGRLLFTVEHAGKAVPSALSDLGLPAGEIDRHIGWDPGAADLAHTLHGLLGGVLVEQPYSRLVIDCNRPFGAPDLIADKADGTAVPANRALSDADHLRRWNGIHRPFHAEIAAHVERRPAALVSVHSYDPRRRADAAIRPWPIGLLFRRETSLARHLVQRLGTEDLARPLGMNEPYSVDDESDYTLPVHAEPANLDHVLIEVLNDHLRTAASVSAFACILAGALTSWRER